MTTEKPVDNSVPYPSAPEPDYDDDEQEHYRGVKDPEILAAHKAKKAAKAKKSTAPKTPIPPKDEENDD